jgi:hypothetical protein
MLADVASSPRIMRQRVDFPAPLRPMTPMRWSSWMAASAPSKIAVAP